MVATMAIILLIAGLLFPVFVQSRESARATACRSNLHQIGQALHLYAQDYNGRFPPAEAAWTAAIMPFMKNTGVLACPSEPTKSQKRYGVGFAANPLDAGASYQYRHGLANDDAGSTPIARDWEPWHGGGVNVLYLGGSCRWEKLKDAPTLSAGPRPRPRDSATGASAEG
jgi:prepilin-type processing-associated H-X9-DG protein